MTQSTLFPRGLALLVLLAGMSGASSVQARHSFQAGLGFASAIPQGAFQDNTDAKGYGIGGSFFWRPPSSPLLLGVDLSYLVYGHQERTEFLNPNIPEVTVEVTTDNNLVQGALALRLQPMRGTLRPYVEGLLGFNYLFTESAIRDEDDNEEVASSKNFDDTALAWGGGGGLMIEVYRGDDRPGRVRSVAIDLQGRYLVGGEARYLKEGSIRREESRLTFDSHRSDTDLVTWRVGAALEF